MRVDALEFVMSSLHIVSCVLGPAQFGGPDLVVEPLTIRCYLYSVPVSAPLVLRGDRLLAGQAITLLMRLDGELREARADWNQDRFRRLMRLRPKAVARLRRRWEQLNPPPRIPLGSLRRRYHANLSCYLYESNP
jgi:hypothetical protein